MSKTNSGNFFEDFSLGQVIRHATPRTITEGDVALYGALYGSRFAVQSADTFAEAIGYDRAPVDDLLVFHVVFGKTVPDISLNAIANLGYAGGRFLAPVYPGDTLNAVSEVIGLRENSNGQSGVVYVRSTGFNQDGIEVLDYVRWVMVRKRDPKTPARESHVPSLPSVLAADALGDAVPPLDIDAWRFDLSGSPHRFSDYAVGEKIDHVDGMTVEEAEHMLATRLYQNTAKVHFNQFTEGQGRFGRRLIYGGHVISLAAPSPSTASPTPSMWRASMAAATSPPCLRASPSSPGARCWRRRRFPAATTWAPCACGPSRRRTGPAPISPSSRARTMTRASSSTSTIGCSSPADMPSAQARRSRHPRALTCISC